MFAAVLWGLDGVLMGNAMEHPAFNSFRMISAAVLASALHNGFSAVWVLTHSIFTKNIKQYFSVIMANKKLILAAVVGGALGITLNYVGILFAAVYAIAVASCYPVISALIEKIFLKKKFGKNLCFGIMLVVIGTILISYTPPQDIKTNDFLFGVGCALLAAIGWAIEGIITTRCLQESAPQSVALGINQIISFLFIVLMLPIVLQHSEFSKLSQLFDFNLTRTIFIIAGIGALSFALWYYSMHAIGATNAMGLNATYSLWAVVFHFLINSTAITIVGIMGVAVIFFGALLVIFESKSKISEKNKKM
ncbi:MAG: DMT(drug/metabolite transporter) superfamily permease [Oscillospiraceae bacterium]|nr:DMT(drug/metabolite transporter) superfamily permease [Oscillospiraceae bacterium]